MIHKYEHIVRIYSLNEWVDAGQNVLPLHEMKANCADVQRDEILEHIANFLV